MPISPTRREPSDARCAAALCIRPDDCGRQLPWRRRRNAHANIIAERDLQRRARYRSFVRAGRDRHLGKPRRSSPKLPAPAVNQAGHDIGTRGYLANRGTIASFSSLFQVAAPPCAKLGSQKTSDKRPAPTADHHAVGVISPAGRFRGHSIPVAPSSTLRSAAGLAGFAPCLE
jgi:hypothetical protein